MELLRVQCPSCSGSLPPRAPCGTITCDYCGAKFQSQQVRHAQDQTGQVLSTDQLAKAIVAAQHELGRQQSQRANLQAQHLQHVHGVQISSQTATKVARGAIWMAIVPVIIVLAVSGVITAVTLRSATNGAGLFGGGNKTDATEQLLTWDSNGAPPIVTKVEGKTAIVGQVRSGTDSTMSVDAYDLDGNRLWRVGPLGAYGDVYGKTHVGTANGYLVVSDANSTIRSFDLETGSQVHSSTLSDSVKLVCSPMFAVADEPVDSKEVWFEQVDKRAFFFDPATGALTEAERPAWCLDRDPRGHSRGTELKPPKTDGLKFKRVHQDGEMAVAMGVKSPGTQVPRAIGFAPGSKEVLWDQGLSQVQPGSLRDSSTDHSALAGGRFSATYGEGSSLWHVVTLDAKTGQLLWDITLRPLFSVDWIQGFSVTDEFVLVVRMSSIEVYDAKTGKQRAVIGSTTYEDEH